MKTTKGNVSLLVSLTGLLLLFVLLHKKIVSGLGWEILLGGFEAATVGGLADWFAVSALFQKIPIPVIGNHTNIIVNKREKISNSIVDLVTNEWLAPAVIREKLSKVSISEKIISAIETPEMKQKISEKIRWGLLQILPHLDGEAAQKALRKMLQQQLSEIDVAKHLSKWLRDAVANNKQLVVYEMLLNKGLGIIRDGETQNKLEQFIEGKLKEVKDEGGIKSVFVSVAGIFGGLDSRSLRIKISESLEKELIAAKIDKNHAIRVALDKMLLSLATNIESPDSEEQNMIANWKDALIEKVNQEDLVGSILTRFRISIEADIQKPSSEMVYWIENTLFEMLDNFKKNAEQREKLETSIQSFLLTMLEKNHAYIGETVRESLSKLDDKALVKQIQEKVGDDLEYIRLNGAIIGGIAGLIITLLKSIV